MMLKKYIYIRSEKLTAGCLYQLKLRIDGRILTVRRDRDPASPFLYTPSWSCLEKVSLFAACEWNKIYHSGLTISTPNSEGEMRWGKFINKLFVDFHIHKRRTLMPFFKNVFSTFQPSSHIDCWMQSRKIINGREHIFVFPSETVRREMKKEVDLAMYQFKGNVKWVA